MFVIDQQLRAQITRVLIFKENEHVIVIEFPFFIVK